MCVAKRKRRSGATLECAAPERHALALAKREPFKGARARRARTASYQVDDDARPIDVSRLVHDIAAASAGAKHAQSVLAAGGHTAAFSAENARLTTMDRRAGNSGRSSML